MKPNKKKLLATALRIQDQKSITPAEIDQLLTFTKVTKDHKAIRLLKKIAVPGSLAFGFFFTAFPTQFEQFINTLPSWTNFDPVILQGVNYLWDLVGDPVRKANILYHIPNLILYSFGFFGIKKLLEFVDRKTWLDKVFFAQTNLQQLITQGKLNLKMANGHSILFVGSGDFIGMQQTLNSNHDQTVTISQTKPTYTNIWNYYDIQTLYEDLKEVLLRSDIKSAGEYIFFPVKDDQIFLPNQTAYDLSPHKLDIVIKNIRMIETELKIEPKKVIIIGDKFHKSYVHSEDQTRIIANSKDTISLLSISIRYPNITLIDPSDIVLKHIIRIAHGRRIVFRATIDGIKEYKKRFYERLKQLGYKQNPRLKGILTIGYDLVESQTEQQTLSRSINDYYPIVLSKPVRDALIRNGYKPNEFIYVPELVLSHLLQTSAQQ